MNSPRGALVIGFAGACLFVAGAIATPTLGAPAVTVLVLGTGYGTVGVCAAYFLDRERVLFPLAVLPGAVTGLVALAAGEFAGLLATSDPFVSLLAVGCGAAVTFGFPLGVATRRRTQWFAVGLLLAAVSPLFAVVGAAVLDIKAEGAGALLIVAVVGAVALVPVVLPTYLFGRSVRRSLGGSTATSRPLIAAVAVPLLLVLLALAAVPYMLTYPPVLAAALVAGAGLASLGHRFVRSAA